MPVWLSKRPLPSSVELSLICVSAVRRSIPALPAVLQRSLAHSASSAVDGLRGVFDDAGRQAEAVGVARILRAIAHEDAAGDQAVDDRAARSPPSISTKFAALFQYAGRARSQAA